MNSKFPSLIVFKLSLLLLFGLSGLEATADGYYETSDFSDATNEIIEYAEEHGAENVLMVVDIDNTLLAMNQPLGSDQWFEWQEYLLENEPESPALVANSFSGLLDVQEILFTAGTMRPTQLNQPELFNQVQDLGIPTLILTSRGDQYRSATERELIGNGYKPARNAVKAKGLGVEPYAPYDMTNLKPSGITEEEAKLFALREKPRLVSYGKGIFMSAGQHKGAMLLTVIEKTKVKPKAVVFVDDHGRHVNRVYDALSRRGIQGSVYHYHKEDENVKRFRYSDKSDVIRRWELLQSAMGEALSPKEEVSEKPATMSESKSPAKAH